jgi:hypothetical protein
MATIATDSFSGWVPYSEFELVFSGVLPVGTTGNRDIHIELDTPFSYDGDENLVIMAHRTYVTGWFSNNSWQVTGGYSGRIQHVRSDTVTLEIETTHTGAAVLTSANLPNIKLNFAVGDLGHIAGTVVSNSVGVAGALVTINELGRTATTNATGAYTISNVPVGTYGLTATRFGYSIGTATEVIVVENETTNVPVITINPLSTVTIIGTVICQDNQLGVEDATVHLVGYDNYTVSTDLNGSFVINDVFANNPYTLTISKSGYATYVDEDFEVGNIDIEINPITLLKMRIAFFEDFELATFPPEGWFLVTPTGPGQGWKRNTQLVDRDDILGNNASSGAAVSESYVNPVDPDPFQVLTPVNNWLISPRITIPEGATNVTLNWYVHSVLPNWAAEQYSVLFQYDEYTEGDDVSGFSPIFTETLTPADYNADFLYSFRTFDISKFQGMTFQLAFNHHQPHGQDMFKMAIDDIEVAFTLEGEVSNNDFVVARRSTLGANFPNPFNPTTTIAFDLAVSGHVSIDVFNIKGQKVTTLVNDEFTAGPHTVNWNGEDSNGRSVSSGIYFYRMTTEGFTSTRKMIMMK